jgi:lipopolysaccharide export system permease protein
MQFLWKYIDDMVGKGLSIPILAEMFMYAALSMVPLALPLAILLASLMTFGNLGERLELLAMKAAGVSLLNIMKPLIVTLCIISFGAFFYQNYVTPVAQVKLYTLLWSMRQKSPELDIPEGSFYSEIPGINVYVKKKDHDTGLLKEMMIYDYSNGFNNASVIVADSGRLKTSEDKMFLILSLFNGESFQNLKAQNATNQSTNAVPYGRETFGTKDILISFDANFSLADESFMQNQLGKQLKELDYTIDSMTVILDSVRTVNAVSIFNNSYKKDLGLVTDAVTPVLLKEPIEETKPVKRFTSKKNATEKKAETIVINFDSIYVGQTPQQKSSLVNYAKTKIDNMRSDYFFKAASYGDEATKMRRNKAAWHEKFTLSVACLLFFFIGAPLGAIIRKGGLGLPVVISVLFFIFYYIIDNMGLKMGRDGVWPVWEGKWFSTAILTPICVFLTYKSIKDSTILDADTYLNVLKGIIGKRTARKVEVKEIVMYNPNYTSVKEKLAELSAETNNYLSTTRRWINYITFWKNGGHDDIAEKISIDMESIVEELTNSKDILVLNKIKDFPIISSYNQIRTRISEKAGLTIAAVFPIGLALYFVATYQRKLLKTDMKTITKTSGELIEIITKQIG